MRSKYLIYRDSYISIFNDDEKYLAIFVNDRGQAKVLNYDDNFYSIEEDIIVYNELIKHATSDLQEQQEYLGKFIKYVKREVKKSNAELNIDYLEHYGFDRGLFEDEK